VVEVSVFAILTTHWIVINQFIPDTKVRVTQHVGTHD